MSAPTPPPTTPLDYATPHVRRPLSRLGIASFLLFLLQLPMLLVPIAFWLFGAPAPPSQALVTTLWIVPAAAGLACGYRSVRTTGYTWPNTLGVLGLLANFIWVVIWCLGVIGMSLPSRWHL